ncbi:competence type IV pilus assembly protein ComGB [Paucilactobacillus nenjiangensis]|uniref:competence type IV pilus assembly protein ComGB n=1 Tax=Paucilactobacillus nenjiangensis TaxID=1296540 RepID=UPI003BAE5EAD
MQTWLKREESRGKLLKRSKRDKLSTNEQSKMFVLISDLLKVGFSLQQAITFLQTLLPKHENILQQVDEGLSQGQLFAQSLRPFISKDIYYQLVIAEKHGDLQDCIERLGQYLAVRVKQKNTLKGLLQYPIILLSMLGVLLIALKIFVFPELETWQNQDQAVTPTKHLYVVGFALCGVFALAVAIQLWHKWRQQTTNQKIQLMCRLPIIGESYRLYYAYYLVTNFSLLLSNGMGMKSICQMFASFDEESLLHQLGISLNQILAEGNKPELLLKEYSYLPMELIIFVNKGETPKELGKQLEAFSNVLFKRLTSSIEKLLTMIQPLLFGVIAVVIVLLYLSIMLPIYHSMKGIY